MTGAYDPCTAGCKAAIDELTALTGTPVEGAWVDVYASDPRLVEGAWVKLKGTMGTVRIIHGWVVAYGGRDPEPRWAVPCSADPSPRLELWVPSGAPRVVDANEYGATGNGVTDDTDANPAAPCDATRPQCDNSTPDEPAHDWHTRPAPGDRTHPLWKAYLWGMWNGVAWSVVLGALKLAGAGLPWWVVCLHVALSAVMLAAVLLFGLYLMACLLRSFS